MQSPKVIQLPYANVVSSSRKDTEREVRTFSVGESLCRIPTFPILSNAGFLVKERA